MQTKLDKLPGSVHRLELDGRIIFIVGTAHVSRKSVEDVEETISKVQPDTICVELCEPRFKAMTEKDAWKKMDILKIVKEKKTLFLLSQLIISSFYKKIGEELGVQPGEEMLKGIELSREMEAKLVLADRKIEITLKRVWGYLGFWSKIKLLFHLITSLVVSPGIDSEMVEEMKNKDQLENVMDSFAGAFPEIKKRLIDERDVYLSQKIRESSGQKIVAVVGAGHIPGIKRYISETIPVEPIMETPPASLLPKILKWAIPALIIALVVYGFLKGGVSHSVESIYIWVFVNGLLSAAGAALAFAHPFTIFSAFVGAPVTSLNPMIAAGWVAGLVQAWVKKPTVTDLEDLPVAVTTVKGFWLNPVTRILLVVIMANMGSSLGTFIAGSWIAMRVF
ncbi:MAG: TraB/GumN family protein [Nitrospinota bacterium]